jgi:hypothetical protein
MIIYSMQMIWWKIMWWFFRKNNLLNAWKECQVSIKVLALELVGQMKFLGLGQKAPNNEKYQLMIFFCVFV